MPAETFEASSTDINLGKLKPHSLDEKKQLELQGICVRSRQPGRRAGDERCKADMWQPAAKLKPPEPGCERLEWRQNPGGLYTLFIESDGRWKRYSSVHDRVRHIRRWAKKTGRAHNERELKLLEVWEVAQREMAKRDAALRGSRRSTVFPA